MIGSHLLLSLFVLVAVAQPHGPAPVDPPVHEKSALMLSVVVARDNEAAFLTDAEFRQLLDAALAYLSSEQDVRGYLGEKGWAHSAAHTADLLKFLARSRYLAAGDQGRILSAISRKLATTPAVFVYGEDERLARAILSIVRRQDFDANGFRLWAGQAAPKFPAAASLSVTSLQAFQNMKNLLTKLEMLIAANDAKSPAEAAAFDAVRAALKTAF